MKVILRHVLLLGVSAVLSWWLFLANPALEGASQASAPAPSLPMALEPLERSATPPSAPAEPEEATRNAAPPASEIGSPEGLDELPPQLAEPEAVEVETPRPEPLPREMEEELADSASDTEEATASLAVAEEQTSRQAAELMQDSDLLAAARNELEGKSSKGFSTVLLAAPEEQLELASFFGEELLLVPRAALDPDGEDPRYFRVALDGGPRIEQVRGRPPLEGYRQYRDLFDYEYARLPSLLRELRRGVLSRNEIYLFAALIPTREWALIVGRRAEALARSGRDASEVRRFVIRYVRSADGGFDVHVETIVFADETRFQPPAPKRGA